MKAGIVGPDGAPIEEPGIVIPGGDYRAPGGPPRLSASDFMATTHEAINLFDMHIKTIERLGTPKDLRALHDRLVVVRSNALHLQKRALAKIAPELANGADTIERKLAATFKAVFGEEAQAEKESAS